MRLEQLGSRAREIVRGGSLAVVTDENVERLHLDKCIKILEKAGFAVYPFIIPPGEASKSGEQYLKLLNFLAEVSLTRADAVVALGGGIVGDLAGFAAATYLRGIAVIQVPTTLLAATDSSIGGKTAINLPAGKNLAGAFHQPALICRDVRLLETLPEDVFKDGMAEVIKYGVIADAELFDFLKDTEAARGRLDWIIQRCAAIKESFVREDERDMGARQLLNFGHTIGHAIERLSDFEISHGSAVAKGMDQMAEISLRQGWCGRDCREAIRGILTEYRFDLNVPYSKAELFDIMLSDKKRKGNEIDIVTPVKIGQCRLHRISVDALRELL